MAVSTATACRISARGSHASTAPEKVTGQARFGDDLPLYGLLHARLLLGVHAHARIVSIDASKALKQPGVVAVITADDLATLLKSPPTSRAREMLAKGETRFCGQPVAAVVAETEAAAEDALAPGRGRVRGATGRPRSARDALTADAPAVWPDGVPGSKAAPRTPATPPSSRPNLADHVAYDRGDVEAGFAEADVVVERSYHTADRPPELPRAAHHHRRSWTRSAT